MVDKSKELLSLEPLGDPKLLIMDEATSALDYKTEKNVCDNLANSLKKQTVFFITHRLATIRQADLIIYMKMAL